MSDKKVYTLAKPLLWNGKLLAAGELIELSPDEHRSVRKCLESEPDKGRVPGEEASRLTTEAKISNKR